MLQATSGLRERKKEQVRSKILAVAEEMFRHGGYPATSMADIAERVEISRKTLFNYMESKESIIVALVEAFVSEKLPEWTEPSVPLFGDVRDVVAPGLEGRLDAIAEKRWLLELAARHTRMFTADRTVYIDQAHAINRQARIRRISTVQAQGGIRSDVPAIEISNFYECLRDLVLKSWLLDRDSITADLHLAFARSMDVLLRGLLPVGRSIDDASFPGARKGDRV